MAARDYYAVLGVAPGSEDVVITAAYRALMRRYHPDTNRDPAAQQKAQEINEAYAVLGDAVKRSAYDRLRSTERAGPKKEKPRAKPDPGKSKGPASGSGANDGTANPRAPRSSPQPKGGAQKGSYGWLIAAVLICIIALPAIVASNDSAENTMNVDETLTTENVVSYDEAADALDAAADANMNLDETLTTENVISDVPPPNLARQDAGAVEYKNVERAAQRFAEILMKDGMIGARSFSDRCHKGVVANPTWQGADFCAAFDFAAAHVDASISRDGNFSRNGYFQFQSDNQDESYVAAGASRYVLSTRLSTIRNAVKPAVVEAVEGYLAREQVARERDRARSSAATANTVVEPENGRSD